MPKLSEYEESLVELVHFLAQPSSGESGVTVKEVKHFLTSPIPSRGNQTPLQLLQKQGRGFLNEIIIYIRQSED